jgi:hypothetical protein
MKAIPFASGDTLARWATEQGSMQLGELFDPRGLAGVDVVHYFSGNIDRLPVAFHRDGWLLPERIRLIFQDVSEVLLLSKSSIGLSRDRGTIVLDQHVLAVDTGWPSLLNGGNFVMSWGGHDWPHTHDGSGFRRDRTLAGYVIGQLAIAWSVSEDRIRECSEFDEEKKRVVRVVGTLDGKPWPQRVDVIRRPT